MQNEILNESFQIKQNKTKSKRKIETNEKKQFKQTFKNYMFKKNGKVII
jgi:hypothetical protein